MVIKATSILKRNLSKLCMKLNGGIHLAERSRVHHVEVLGKLSVGVVVKNGGVD